MAKIITRQEIRELLHRWQVGDQYAVANLRHHREIAEAAAPRPHAPRNIRAVADDHDVIGIVILLFAVVLLVAQWTFVPNDVSLQLLIAELLVEITSPADHSARIEQGTSRVCRCGNCLRG